VPLEDNRREVEVRVASAGSSSASEADSDRSESIEALKSLAPVDVRASSKCPVGCCQ